MEASKQPSKPSSNQIREGLDTLWKFQLRKENAALLEKLEENAKAIEACRSENMRHFQNLHERIAFIETTIANIETTEEKASQARELHTQEVEALKKTLENLIQDGIPDVAKVDPRQQNHKEAATSSPGNIEPHVHSAISEHSQAHISSSDLAPICHLTSSLGVLSKIPTNQVDMSSKTTDPIPVLATTIESNAATHINASRKLITARRNVPQNTPATRSTLSNVPTGLQNKTSDFPRLVQGGASSMKAYHTSASKAFANLALDKSGEIEFVARFVKGIHTASNRKLLIKQLEKTNPSFTESGEQQILCEWSEVAEALKSLGLTEPEEVSGAPPAKKKRRVLIPPEMIKDGMIREFSK